jgi:transposase
MAQEDSVGWRAGGFGGRLEVIEGATGRRRWLDAVKARIVAESFARGAQVSAVARRHGLSPQQLTGWRRAARDGLLAMPAALAGDGDDPGFVPLAIEERLEAEGGTGVAADIGPDRSPIEVAVAGVVVRLPAVTSAGRIAEIAAALDGALGGRG